MATLLLSIIYLSFIGLGLPDSLLGSAWPVISQEFLVPVSYAGGIYTIVAMGTVVSSLQSDRLTKWFGSGKVTAFSVALTAVAIIGTSTCREYWQMCLWAIPYGLGAGSVDASLNNYVALHYASCHMSWLHCMWGLGASVGPYIMGMVLTAGMGWSSGYRVIFLLQMVLSVILFLSLPLWKNPGSVAGADVEKAKPLSMKQILSIPGAREIMVAFFCYCALEQTCMLWGSSYFVLHKGLSEETAASLASLFLLGLMFGRFLNGFLTYKMSDTSLIRLGQGLIALGVGIMLLPLGERTAMVGLTLMGLGCAPIYPCIIHSTPDHFGSENSQAMIGVQMASAYVGICCMPPLFGILANHIGVFLLPWYTGAILLVMTLMCERVNQKCR